MSPEPPEISGRKQTRGRWQAGQSGNPNGKPLGARNHATRAAEAMLDGEAPVNAGVKMHRLAGVKVRHG